MMKYPGSMKIGHLKELSTRAKNLLWENDIVTVQEFIDYFSKYGENGVSYFNNKRNAGKKTIAEVQAFVKDFLKDNSPSEDAQEIDEIKSNIKKLKLAIAQMETKLTELENKRNTKQQEQVR